MFSHVDEIALICRIKQAEALARAIQPPPASGRARLRAVHGMASARKDGNVPVVLQGLSMLMSTAPGSERLLADLLHSAVTGEWAARAQRARAVALAVSLPASPSCSCTANEQLRASWDRKPRRGTRRKRAWARPHAPGPRCAACASVADGSTGAGRAPGERGRTWHRWRSHT